MLNFWANVGWHCETSNVAISEGRIPGLTGLGLSGLLRDRAVAESKAGPRKTLPWSDPAGWRQCAY